MIDFEQYIEQTHRTAEYPEDRALTYLALGVVGEVGEAKRKAFGLPPSTHLQSKALAQELGDAYWYVSEMYGLLEEHRPRESYSFNTPGRMDWGEGQDLLEDALDASASLAEAVKKAIRNDGGLTEERERMVCELLHQIRDDLRGACFHLGLGGEDVVLTRNVEKLTGRQEKGTIKGCGDER